MANRLFNQFSFGLEKMRVSLFGAMITDGAGVPSMVPGDSKGIASVSKLAGIGEYRILLQDGYPRLLMMQQISVGSSAAQSMEIKAVDAPNKIIDVLFRDAAGAPVNLGNGEQHLMSIVLRNSSAP